MKEPEEISKLIQDAMFKPYTRKEQDLALLEVIKQIQINAYNEALADAAENATTRINDESTGIIVDKNSILKLRK